MDLAPYDAQQGNIEAAWQAANSQVNQQRTNLGTQYGGTFDAGGNFSIDNTSQYGAVQNLRMNQGLDLTQNADDQNTRGIGMSGFGLAGQKENLMRFNDRQQQFGLLNQAQSAYTQTASDLQNAKLTHDSATTSLGIDKANELALENSWIPAPTPGVPGAPTSPIPGVGNSQTSYLPPSILAAAAAKSKTAKVGQTGNSGIHGM